jgi:hypothetical protein
LVASSSLCAVCLGQDGAESGKAGSASSEAIVNAQIELARQQFEFQKELENKKLEIERQKAGSGSITGESQ